jgi:hypothetical protein
MTDSNFIKPLDSFVSEVINYLPDYLRKDNLVKFMTVFLDRLEALDNSFIQLAEYRLLVNAQGVVLDDIGTQMGLYRNGQSDDDFRTILLIRQAAAVKGGTRPQVEEALQNLFSATNWELYKGDNYRIDLYAASPCFDLVNISEDIVETFPIMTQLRIVETDYLNMGFGFEGDEDAGGFGSSNDESASEAGMLLKVVYVTDKAVHGTT